MLNPHRHGHSSLIRQRKHIPRDRLILSETLYLIDKMGALAANFVAVALVAKLAAANLWFFRFNIPTLDAL
jgi:hypothetical protein